MEAAIAKLGMLMGMSFTSGINLYMTIFLVGLSQAMGWLKNPPAEVQFLNNPLIIGVAGFMYFIEFFADKVPGLDHAWDAVHTFIRPLAAGVIAMKGVGDVNPALMGAAFLLGGGIAGTTHSVKAGGRVMVNLIPIPFLNVGVSVGEDAAVFGMTAFMMAHPVWTFFITIILTALAIWLMPKCLRAAWMMFRGLVGLLAPKRAAGEIGARAVEHVAGSLQSGEKTVATLDGANQRRIRKAPWLKRGTVLLTDRRLVFIFHKWFMRKQMEIPLAQVTAVHIVRRLIFVQVIVGTGERAWVFTVPKSHRVAAEFFTQKLAESCGLSATGGAPATEPKPQPGAAPA